jgi:hypothetical protein
MPVSAGETTTSFATWGRMILATSQALPLTSRATWSVLARLPAKSSSAAGVISMRPGERTSPPSAIATSQKSRWMSRPIDLIGPPIRG